MYVYILSKTMHMLFIKLKDHGRGVYALVGIEEEEKTPHQLRCFYSIYLFSLCGCVVVEEEDNGGSTNKG